MQFPPPPLLSGRLRSSRPGKRHAPRSYLAPSMTPADPRQTAAAVGHPRVARMSRPAPMRGKNHCLPSPSTRCSQIGQLGQFGNRLATTLAVSAQPVSNATFMADAPDSKSGPRKGGVGSSPTFGIEDRIGGRQCSLDRGQLHACPRRIDSAPADSAPPTAVLTVRPAAVTLAPLAGGSGGSWSLPVPRHGSLWRQPDYHKQ